MNQKMNLKASLGMAASALVLAVAIGSTANALPIRDDIGVDGAVDSDNVWAGVGMMWNRTPGGTFVCTGQLINPRTVVWAAHCVDGFNETLYGGEQGGIPIGFGFEVDSLPGYFDWRDRGLATGEWSSNPDLAFYNVLQVQAPFGLDGEFDFPGGDLALATLDTPAIGLPTYGMLFSPITEDTPVSMVGYGGTGIGSGVNEGIDGKRRAGTNMLNGLFSQMDFLGAAFGVPGLAGVFGPSGDQLLYHIDFDRPDRDASDCYRAGPSGNPAILGPADLLCDTPPWSNGVTWDFGQLISVNNQIDWFPGDATEREAGTLGGDSGSGLFVEMDGHQLITGVLAGGWVSGLFSPANSLYADVSYYNPLFLYQNWIAEQNPYVYATAAAGDGDWSDASRWTRAMDPSYFIVDAQGNLVNGMWADAPETPEDGLALEGPLFGTIFDTTAEGYRDGNLFDNSPDYGASSSAESAASTAASSAGSSTRSVDSVIELGAGGMSYGPAQMTAGVQVIDDSAQEPRLGGFLPADNIGQFDDDALHGGETPSTVISVAESDGQPHAADTDPPVSGFAIGSSDFVPNNSYGLFGTFAGAITGDVARFYDVTLSASGTTTVDMNVEIDRLRITGSDAGFFLPEEHIFSTLIAFDQSAGQSRIDGLLLAREVMMTGGLLHGDGVISTLTFWNVAGMVSPGALGEIGELLILGDYVQTAAGALVFDWSAEGSDMLLVDGSVALGGVAGINPVGGYIPTFGDQRTVLEYTGDRAGEFDGMIDLPGVLFLSPIYSDGMVALQVLAENFSDFANFTNPSQAALGSRFDSLRGDPQAGPVASLFQVIDLLPNGPLEDAFENLVPHEGFQLRRTLTSHGDLLASALRGRMLQGPGASGGTPGGNQAMFSLMGSEAGAGMDGMSLAEAVRAADTGGQPDVHDLGNGFEVFFTAGLVDASAPTTASSANADIEGGFAMAGIDYGRRHGWRVGAAIGFATSESDQALAGGGAATSRVESVQLTGYAAYRGERLQGLLAASYGDHSSRARRDVAIGGLVMPVTGTLSATSYDLTGQIGYTVTNGALRATPMAGITWHRVEVDAGSVAGSPAAFDLSSYSDSFTTARVGLDAGIIVNNARFTLEPRAYIGYANRLSDENETIAGDFAGTPGTQGLILGTGVDAESDWFEVSVGAIARLNNGIDLSLAYETRAGSNRIRDVDALIFGLRTRF